MEVEISTIVTVVNSLICAFMAVLFLQSGLDKVFDYQGNLSWLTGHFSKSIFNGMVPILLTVLTVFELLAGLLTAVGALIIFDGESKMLGTFGFYGLTFSGVSLLSLFLGQRIAKDYAGAATLTGYFVIVLIGLIMNMGVIR